MGRRESQGSFSSCSMQAIEYPAFQLLLQKHSSQSVGDPTHATCRRDLYGKAFSWFAQNYSRVEEGRLRCQSQAYPENYATVGGGWQSARPQHLQATSGTHQVSLFARECDTDGAIRGVEHRYHIYPTAKRTCVSRRRYRLVQPSCAVPSSFQQLRNKLLLGCSRRCDRKAWKAQNLQHRSGSAIYLERVRSSDYQPRYSFQHGWKRKSFRQCICRTSMEVREV